MRVADRLQLLLDAGAIEAVLRPLMAGKEAEVFLVEHEGKRQVAKIYKEATERSFKHRADYTEGRKVRSTRSQRAMSKRSRFGRAEEEEAWRNAEVDALYRAHDAGVRVPEPLHYQDGVLIMELVLGEDGEPAPRLVDLKFAPDHAEELFLHLVGETQRLLCAGIVHGDLSDFNVLMGPDGPVLIDFPQAVDPAHNNNARRLLVRDVRNLSHFLGRWAPRLKRTRYGEEMWALYEKNQLEPDTELTGKYAGSTRKANTRALLDEIADVAREESRRRAAMGLGPLAGFDDSDEDPVERSRKARQEALETLARIKAQKARDDAAELQAKLKAKGSTGGEGGGGGKRRRKRRRRGRGPSESGSANSQHGGGQPKGQGRGPDHRRGGGPQQADGHGKQPPQRDERSSGGGKGGGGGQGGGAGPSGEAPRKKRRRRRRRKPAPGDPTRK